jgi:hypothetical protein
MPYDLDDFRAELNAAITSRGIDGLPAVADALARLLANPKFVAATFDETMPPGKRQLARDPGTGALVLAHVHAPAGEGAPHTHGDSWAVYGTARGVTAITEWTTVDDGQPGRALTASARYTLGPGEARAYHSGAIHSVAQAETTWVIRVTGTDLDQIPRYRFDRTRDRIVEPAPAT